MRKKNGNSGFTMIELLAVVAIIGILAGVGFAVFQRTQRNVTRLEEDAIAKEIFVAAQNHLTMARMENYQGLTNDDKFGKKGNYVAESDAEKDVFYYIVNQGDAFNRDDPGLIDMILPEYAIDESVRMHGKYLIRYQRRTGLVLDVFYFTEKMSGNRYALNRNLEDSDYSALLGCRDEEHANHASDRLSYGTGAVVGWYGNQKAVEIPKEEHSIERPVIEVVNAEKLAVKVYYPVEKLQATNKLQIKLIVEGETSHTKKVFTIMNDSNFNDSDDRVVDYTPATTEAVSYQKRVILDDITAPNMHFANLVGDDPSGTGAEVYFYPGENLKIQAVAFNNEVITNIAYSDVETTNSLFEKLDTTKDSEGNTVYTASINNIRHMENLDKTISTTDKNKANSITVQNAVQTTDLDWTTFKAGDVTKNGVEVQIYDGAGSPATTKVNCFKPVNPDYKISYDGKGHNIFFLVVNHPGDAGLFGGLTVEGCEVKNLALVDSMITNTALSNAGGASGGGTGTSTITSAAGALVGAIRAKANVENVIAYNTSKFEQTLSPLTTIKAGSGDAGGLIGTVTAEGCTIKKCAAALVVESTDGNAGGLIGSMTGAGAMVEDCYSGGHTDNGAYYEYDTTNGKHKLDSPIYNIRAEAGIAGGLIGVAGATGDVKTTVKACYSTCSVKGKTAGGFAGTFDGMSITNCYATGLVCGIDDDPIVEEGVTVTRPKDGAFAYSVTATTVTDCRYFEIVNERIKRDTSENGEKKATIYATVTETDQDTSKNIYVYLTALGKNDKTSTGITALDADATSYEDFVGAPATWKTAIPYDAKLLEYYSVKDAYDKYMSSFNLKGIPSLDSSVTEDDFVFRHYGDWPAPEIFVFNTKTTP